MEIRGIKKRKRDGWAWQARGEDAYCRGGGRNVKNCNGFCMAQAYYPMRILSASYNDLNEDGRKIQKKYINNHATNQTETWFGHTF